MSDKPKDWVQEARERCFAATPEPWDGVISSEAVRYLGPTIPGAEHGAYIAACGGDVDADQVQANKHLIAASRADLPRALDVIEAADALALAVEAWGDNSEFFHLDLEALRARAERVLAALAAYQEKRK